MNTRRAVWGAIIVAVTAIAAGNAFATLQDPQEHQQHHPEAAQESAAEMPAMCQQMMAEMHEHMGNMQQMMAHMHGDQATMPAEHEHGMMGAQGGMMGDMAGMMSGMMGMMSMMATADPSSIDDPAVAEGRATMLETMVERMRTHITEMQAQAEALRKRAAEIR